MVSLIPGIAEKLNIPRAFMSGFKLGRPCGEPFDFETRQEVVHQMLKLATEPAGKIVHLE